MKNQLLVLITLILFVSLAACGGGTVGSRIEIQDPWIRAVGATEMSANEAGMDSGSMIGSTVAAFLTIKNKGKEDDKLVAVASDVADVAEIHLSEMKADVMTMRQVDGVVVPAGSEAILQPGGYHIMLIGLKKELAIGEKVSLALMFEKAGQVSVEAEVRAMP